MIVALKAEQGRTWICCREAAEEYGCSMSYIRRLARAGRLDTDVLAGGYVFDKAQVRQLAAEAAKAKGRMRKRAGGFKPG